MEKIIWGEKAFGWLENYSFENWVLERGTEGGSLGKCGDQMWCVHSVVHTNVQGIVYRGYPYLSSKTVGIL